LTAIELGDSDTIEVGDVVIAIGHPYGLQATATLGIVSGLGRRRDARNPTDFIQTDAAINPGNSGGPLLDSRGRLVGLNSWIINPARNGGGNIGIGFSVPVRTAMAVAEQLKTFGEVRRGRLGIEAEDVTREVAEALGLSRRGGALVKRVQPGLPGDRAGLRSRDVVLEAGGRRIEVVADLLNVVGLARPDSEVPLIVLRGGEQVPLVARTEPVPPRRPLVSLYGAAFAVLPADLPIARHVRGVIVERVLPGTNAAREGLRPGDVVTHVNRQPVADLDRLAAVVRGLRELAALTTVRGNSEFIIILRPE
jgi:S1-C subfamily serine protease